MGARSTQKRDGYRAYFSGGAPDEESRYKKDSYAHENFIEGWNEAMAQEEAEEADREWRKENPTLEDRIDKLEEQVELLMERLNETG